MGTRVHAETAGDVCGESRAGREPANRLRPVAVADRDGVLQDCDGALRWDVAEPAPKPSASHLCYLPSRSVCRSSSPHTCSPNSILSRVLPPLSRCQNRSAIA
eukprot:1077239-Rhodomonas_salina.2